MLSGRRSRRRLYLAFFVLHTLLLSVYLDAALNYSAYFDRVIYRRLPNANIISRTLPIEALVDKGTFEITGTPWYTMDRAQVGDRWYSDKAPLPTLVAVPGYATLLKLGVIDRLAELERREPPGRPGKVVLDGPGPVVRLGVAIGVGGFFAGVLPFVGAMLLCLRELVARQKMDPKQALWLATLPFYGSFLFGYAGAYFNHLFAAIWMLLALHQLRAGRFASAGFLASLACVSEYTLALVWMCWALVLAIREGRFRPLLKFVAASSPAVVAMMGYNWITTGHPLVLLYRYSEMDTTRATLYGIGAPTFESLWGLSLGTRAGVFLFAPALLAIGFAVVRRWHKRWREQDLGRVARDLGRSYVVLPLAVSFLSVSGYGQWHGGVSFGPRHLTTFVVIGFFAGMPYLARDRLARRILWGLMVLSLPVFWVARNTFAYVTRKDPARTWEALTESFPRNNLISLFTELTPASVGIVWVLLAVAGMVLLGRMGRKGDPLTRPQT